MKNLSLIVLISLSIFCKNLHAQDFQNKNLNQSVYSKVDVQPEFPGGDDALFDYFHKTLRYKLGTPKFSTTAYFIVRLDGSVTSLKLTPKVPLDIEAKILACFGNMPKWKPGTYQGKPVDVEQEMPIFFNPPKSWEKLGSQKTNQSSTKKPKLAPTKPKVTK